MDVLHANVNPVSTSNALYEMMLDWRACVMMRDASSKAGRAKLKIKRQVLEANLARFFGVDIKEMRELLNAHFDMAARTR
jgi:hypothetical protein